MSHLTVSLLQILFVSILMVAAQLLLKAGMRGSPALEPTPGAVLGLLHRVLTTPVLLVGWACGTAATLVWLIVLSRLELSYASPTMTGLYFVLLLLATRVLLAEAVSPVRWAGTVLVIFGIFLMSRKG